MHKEKFLEMLNKEYETRVSKNPSYSLRSFARGLEVEASSLRQIMQGARPLSDKMAKRLLVKFDLGFDELEYLMGKVKLRDPKLGVRDTIKEDAYQVIADWYHYAILELTHIKSFRPEPKWIASALRISLAQVNLAVQRLIRLNYLEIKDGIWIDRLGDVNNAGNEYTGIAFRKLQKQVLEKAILALQETPYEDRVQSSMTLPVNKKNLKYAKKRILNFIEELSEELRHGEKLDEIYNISLSLYPVSFASKKRENE